jgi:hypothetical protein
LLGLPEVPKEASGRAIHSGKKEEYTMIVKKPYIIELAPTLQHHWYYVWNAAKQNINAKGKLLGVYPSATTILNAYPQSVQLTHWIAEKGWNESQRIKSEAGERGTAIHKGIEFLLDGGDFRLGEMIPNHYRPISLEEYWKLSTFVAWYNECEPKILYKELRVFSKKGGYAGTFDALVILDGKVTVIDWKSSSAIHEHFALQVASYAKAIEENANVKIDQTACLQLGAQNKNGYRLVVYPEWREHYKVFEHVKATWLYENFGSKKNPKDPPVLELPDVLKLDMGK